MARLVVADRARGARRARGLDPLLSSWHRRRYACYELGLVRLARARRDLAPPRPRAGPDSLVTFASIALPLWTAMKEGPLVRGEVRNASRYSLRGPRRDRGAIGNTGARGRPDTAHGPWQLPDRGPLRYRARKHDLRLSDHARHHRERVLQRALGRQGLNEYVHVHIRTAGTLSANGIVLRDI